MSTDLTPEQQLKLARALWPERIIEVANDGGPGFRAIWGGVEFLESADLTSNEAVGAMVEMVESYCRENGYTWGVRRRVHRHHGARGRGLHADC